MIKKLEKSIYGDRENILIDKINEIIDKIESKEIFIDETEKDLLLLKKETLRYLCNGICSSDGACNIIKNGTKESICKCLNKNL